MGAVARCVLEKKESDLRIQYLTVFVCLFVLSACVQAAPEPTQTVTPVPVSTHTPVSQPTATLPPTVTPEPTLTQQFFFPEPVGEPAANWEGIPVMPEAIAGNGDQESYLYSVFATSQEVKDFYCRMLSNDGWGLLGEGQSDVGESVMIIFSKDTNILTISILPAREDGKVLVMIIK